MGESTERRCGSESTVRSWLAFERTAIRVQIRRGSSGGLTAPSRFASGGARCFTGLPGSSPGQIRWGLPEVQAWGFAREERATTVAVYVGSSLPQAVAFIH